jgi:formate C-acetyltransferase
MLRCRKSGVLTGLPDGYGRGRIIGDYRRVALYGIRYLVRERELQFADLQSNLEYGQNLEATIRLREELAEHRRALLQMQEMAAKYGCDISRPAQCPGSGAVGLFCLSGGGEIAERRRHVAGPHRHFPRYLH